jgi:hypothetical protein
MATTPMPRPQWAGDDPIEAEATGNLPEAPNSMMGVTGIFFCLKPDFMVYRIAGGGAAG